MHTCHVVNVSRHEQEILYRKTLGGQLISSGNIPVGGEAKIYCNDDDEVFAVSKSLDAIGAVEGRIMLVEHEKAWLIYSWDSEVKEEIALDSAEHNLKAESVISQAATDETVAEGEQASDEVGPIAVEIRKSGAGKVKAR